LILTEIFPHSDVTGELSLENTEALEHWYPQIEGLRFNFVISNRSELDASSEKLTNIADRTLLKFIRSQSDLIITTGKTARAENLHASKFAPMLIVTRSAKEFHVPAVTNDSGKPVYLTQKLGTVYPSDKAIAIGGFQDSVPAFTESFCQANNFVRPVLECGIETAKQFCSEGKVLEVDLTLVGFESQASAENSAFQFLERICFESPKLIQILRFEDTWFFRFGSQKSID